MRKLSLILSIIGLLSISGCGAKNALPDDPVIFEQGVTGEYAYLYADDKIYVPYCPFETKYLGDCIGYCDIADDDMEESSREYIFEFKGYPSAEWIVATQDLDHCREGMVLREINTTNIPDGLESEYEWND